MDLRSPRVLFAIFLVGVAAVYAAYAAFGSPAPVTMPVPSVFSVNGKSFAITYTATNSAEREAGLMNKQVTNTTFMLFVFRSAGTYGFWMYNTNTSLDMIWINASGGSGQVVYVHADAQPCYNSLTCPTFASASAANYVIEAKAGFAEANGILVGTTIEFEAPAILWVS